MAWAHVQRVKDDHGKIYEFKEVHGHRLSLNGLECFIYRHDEGFSVVEPITGLAMWWSAKTAKEAIKKSGEMTDKVRDAIVKRLMVNVSPAYKERMRPYLEKAMQEIMKGVMMEYYHKKFAAKKGAVCTFNKVRGHKITVRGLEMFIYRDGGTYRVVEPITGLRVGISWTSARLAIEDADSKVETAGLSVSSLITEKLLKQIEKVRRADSKIKGIKIIMVVTHIEQ